jgi:hydrogenase expression/formation protein HypD
MKYIDEFRDRPTAQTLAHRIREEISEPLTFMEVCGTHTMAVFQFGLKNLLPPELKLLSGPGCPVCVTSASYLAEAVYLAGLADITIASYGDMVRVPGPSGNLERARSRGADVRVVYSALDAVELARACPDRKVVFLGVGFETTAPTVAAAILAAQADGIDNFHVLSANKTMPGAMRFLAADQELKIDGFVLPAHVSTIIGVEPYRFLAEEFGIPCVIAGFEPLDVLAGILMLIRQIKSGEPTVEIEYSRVARPEGNRQALGIIENVFQPVDSVWRGLGNIPGSGLEINQQLVAHDARTLLQDVRLEVPPDPEGCLCGLVLTGRATPLDCSLFRVVCRPETPVGACMVSREGTCAAYYHYN